jgi:hypothetical protein
MNTITANTRAEMNQPRELSQSLDELRDFLCSQAAEISRLLHGDVEIARQTLAKHIEQLKLTPAESPEGPLLGVSDDVELFNVLGDSDGVCSSNGGQRRDRTADVGLFRAPSKRTKCPGIADMIDAISVMTWSIRMV